MERAAGSAKAIATTAITAVRTITMPVARKAAGGSWPGAAWCGWSESESVVIGPPFSTQVEFVAPRVCRRGRYFNTY